MYQTPAAKAATRALSLLAQSYNRKDCSGISVGNSPEFLHPDMVRAFPLEFWEQIVEWASDSYGPNCWLEGFAPDFQIIGAVLLFHPDEYGNSFLVEFQYNDQGHRSLIALPRSIVADIVTSPLVDIVSHIRVYCD